MDINSLIWKAVRFYSDWKRRSWVLKGTAQLLSWQRWVISCWAGEYYIPVENIVKKESDPKTEKTIEEVCCQKKSITEMIYDRQKKEREELFSEEFEKIKTKRIEKLEKELSASEVRESHLKIDIEELENDNEELQARNECLQRRHTALREVKRELDKEIESLKWYKRDTEKEIEWLEDYNVSLFDKNEELKKRLVLSEKDKQNYKDLYLDYQSKYIEACECNRKEYDEMKQENKSLKEKLDEIDKIVSPYRYHISIDPALWMDTSGVRFIRWMDIV